MVGDQPFDTTSFIPKKSLTDTSTGGRPGMGIFSVFGILVLIVSIGLALGAYLYRGSLKSAIENEKATLKSQQEKFEPSTISDLRTTDRRINTAALILDDHLAVSPIFQEINKYTISTVQFTKFTYAVNTNQSGGVTDIVVEMTGKANSFSYIALQAEELAKSKYFSNIIVSNLTENERNERSFDITFSIDPKLALLKTVIGAGGQTTSPQQ